MRSTVSKAADMSIMMSAVNLLLLRAYKILSAILIRVVFVEKSFLYAHWNLSCKLLISKCSYVCPTTTFSKFWIKMANEK